MDGAGSRLYIGSGWRGVAWTTRGIVAFEAAAGQKEYIAARVNR